MTDNNELNDPTVAMDSIDDYEMLHATQMPGHSGTVYRVVDLRDGRNVHRVDVQSCEAGNDHELYALLVHETPDLDVRMLNQGMQSMIEAHNAIETFRQSLDSQARQTNAGGESGGGAGGSESDGGGSDELVTPAAPSDADEQLVAQLADWFDSAEESSHSPISDASIVDLEWCSVEGVEGVKIETEPFSSGYYKDDDWADKDGFDGAKENVKSVLKSMDEVRWYGDPDYINFIPGEDIPEVLG